MLLSKHYFHSKTENKFNLNDNKSNVVGEVQERIEVSLTSVTV